MLKKKEKGKPAPAPDPECSLLYLNLNPGAKGFVEANEWVNIFIAHQRIQQKKRG